MELLRVKNNLIFKLLFNWKISLVGSVVASICKKIDHIDQLGRKGANFDRDKPNPVPEWGSEKHPSSTKQFEGRRNSSNRYLHKFTGLWGSGVSNAPPDLQGSGSIANTIVLIFLWNYFLGLLYSGADIDWIKGTKSDLLIWFKELIELNKNARSHNRYIAWGGKWFIHRFYVFFAGTFIAIVQCDICPFAVLEVGWLTGTLVCFLQLHSENQVVDREVLRR